MPRKQKEQQQQPTEHKSESSLADFTKKSYLKEMKRYEKDISKFEKSLANHEHERELKKQKLDQHKIEFESLKKIGPFIL